MKKSRNFFLFIFILTLTVLPKFLHAAPEVVQTLNDLIHTSKDAQDGYYASAQKVQSPDLKNLFLNLSRERSEFVNDLAQQVKDEGGTPSDRGTAEGVFYRGWIDVKTAWTKNDDHAVLAEILKAENVGLNRYEESLKRNDLPEVVRTTLQKQAEKVRSANYLIEKLKGASEDQFQVQEALEGAKKEGLDTRV